MIKTIYFDFDGVIAISESGGKAVAQNLSPLIGVPVDKISETFYKTGKSFLSGEDSVETFLEKFSQALGKEVTIENLASAYCKVPLNKKLIELIEKFKEKYSVELITNNNLFRFQMLQERNLLDVWQVFNKVHISSEKNKPKQQFIFELGEPSEALLIDNNQKFLNQVAEKGMKTLLFDSLKNDIVYLEKEINRI